MKVYTCDIAADLDTIDFIKEIDFLQYPRWFYKFSISATNDTF